VINNKIVHNLPPVFVLKQKQVLINLSSKDFSFVGEKPMIRLYEIFADLNIKPNLTQNGAVSILICIDDLPEKIETLAFKASEIFDVQIEKDLTLLTIRHYNQAIIETLTKMKYIVLEQKTQDTVQILMKNDDGN
jgi:aspartate kinase